MGNKCCGDRGSKRSTAQLRLLEQAKCKCRFEEPAIPIGAAGGTASFFTLAAADSTGPQGPRHWLGKDLEHAFDELEFYEAAQHLRGSGPQWQLLDHMVEYRGALQDFPVSRPDGQVLSLSLLVLENLVGGLALPRFLDLKIGTKTASANWKGKSALASWRQGILDSLTNSTSEGLRLEGFLNPPRWLASEDPLHDLGGSNMWSGSRSKRARRLAMQRLTTSQVLAAFADLRHAEEDSDSGTDAEVHGVQGLLPAEHAEVVVLDVVRQLAQILRACGHVPVPQKWIGSSVAIIADAGKVPSRASLGSDPAAGEFATVRIFDWGRSELNTVEQHEGLPEEDREDRASYWSMYQVGMERLLWEAARLYCSSFCVRRWTDLQVTVYDYDSHTQNDVLGVAEMALPAAGSSSSGEPVTLQLRDTQGRPVMGANGKNALIQVSARFTPCPLPSRLAGVWRIRVESAANLPAGDVGLTSKNSDPFAVVALLEAPRLAAEARESEAAGSRLRAQARTAVIESTMDPVWSEELEFAVSAGNNGGTAGAGDSALRKALAAGSSPLEGGDLCDLLPPPQELGPAADHGEPALEPAQAAFFQAVRACWAKGASTT